MNNQTLEPQEKVKKTLPPMLTTDLLLNRGMTEEECKIICTAHQIPLREKLFFRIIYEALMRPFEVLNLQIENWDRKQDIITALRVKTKTRPMKGNKHSKEYLPTEPKTMKLSPITIAMLKEYVSNRKKGAIFINEGGKQLTLEWFNQAISKYAKLLGIQRIKRYYKDGRTLKLVTCMALREAGERHHDNAGGSRKLSAAGAGHTMQVKEKHYEKVGEDFEQIADSMEKHHPAFTQGW